MKKQGGRRSESGLSARAPGETARAQSRRDKASGRPASKPEFAPKCGRNDRARFPPPLRRNSPGSTAITPCARPCATKAQLSRPVRHPCGRRKARRGHQGPRRLPCIWSMRTRWRRGSAPMPSIRACCSKPARCEALDVSEIENRSGLVLALDQITDPHNVGAILRTAAAFAVDAIIVTERNAPEFSGVLAKTASGGLEHAPLVEVVNLARALDRLGAAGYLRVGLDSEGPESLEKTTFSAAPRAGARRRGQGPAPPDARKCDVLARLDMPGAIKSLNVSNACAVALALARAALAK